LKPGIGYEWFMRYHSDVFPCDYLVYDGRKFPVPRYYSDLWKRLEAAPSRLSGISPRAGRVFDLRKENARARKDHPDNSPRRLRDRWEHGELMASSKNRKDF